MAQELNFIETASGDWFYILERPHAPKDQWDWMDDADAFGPFPTLEAAESHEYESPSRTSGCEIHEWEGSIDPSAERLINALRAAA